MGTVAESLQEGREKASKFANGGKRSTRGGVRVGAGRKPNYLKRLGMEPLTAAKILANVDELEMWLGLLRDADRKIALDTLKYLTDRRDGKAKQAVELSGGAVIGHTVYRDPILANLSADELASLDSLTRKLALPSPDGPQNQKESKPAIPVIETVLDADSST